MQKTLFDIAEIRVTKSSMKGFGLDIILKANIQLKSIFHDEKQYNEAVKAHGNLTKLKVIFAEFINNVIKNNPGYEYSYSTCELFDSSFKMILEDPADDQYPESMDLIRSCAVEKNIEFDGYFHQRWKESADTIINFDEEYFDDPDKIELYVFLSASVDEEIFEFLQVVYQNIFKLDLTREMILEKIEFLTKEKRIRF